MKKSVAVAAIALILASASYSQTTLEGFRSGFMGFAGDLAGGLAVNSTIGSNWSDAYVGGFPHLGAGMTVGFASTSQDNIAPLFAAMGASVPSELKSLGMGIPIPAAVATFKIGLPILPIDLGIKGGFIPKAIGDTLESSAGVKAEYTNFGLQARYALVKQNLVLPNVSVGISYNYQKGSISVPTGIGAKSFSLTTDQGPTTITASDPELSLGWTSNVFDFTAQASKLLLFIAPYAGAGFTVGTSSVTGGVSSTVSTNYKSNNIGALNSYLASIGGPTLGAQGFTYTAKKSDPVFRVYGGLSLRIVILDIDTQVMYVPASKALGGSVTARLQF